MSKDVVRPVSEFGKDYGLIHEAVVTGRKVGAGEIFWAALAHDEELFRRTVSFVEHDGVNGESSVSEVPTRTSPVKVPVLLPITKEEEIITAILGTGQILTRSQAHGEVEFPIRYSEATFHTCAEENAAGCDWWLVYLHGNSLREERVRVGTNRTQQPCFDPHYTLIVSESENSLATEKFEPGYYLIDFNGRFGRTAWKKQGQKIAKLGSQFERAHEAMVTEAAMRIFEATRKRLLLNWLHWGRSLSSGGNRVNVGNFGLRGFEVDDSTPLWGGHNLMRVCVLRKFDL